MFHTALAIDFRITSSTRLQFRGIHNSPTARPRGERSGYFVTSLALRQSFMDNDLSFTFQVRDIIGTMARESINFGDVFYTFRSWDPNTPALSLRVSCRINNTVLTDACPAATRGKMLVWMDFKRSFVAGIVKMSYWKFIGATPIGMFLLPFCLHGLVKTMSG